MLLCNISRHVRIDYFIKRLTHSLVASIPCRARNVSHLDSDEKKLSYSIIRISTHSRHIHTMLTSPYFRLTDWDDLHREEKVRQKCIKFPRLTK